MGKDDARRDSGALGRLALALLLVGCLNPRPEELPSASEPQPGAANGAPAAAAAAPESPGSDRATGPGDDLDLEDVAPESESNPALEAPPAPADAPASEPPDAGGSAESASDAGVPDAG